MFLCGSFHHRQHEDDDLMEWDPCLTPRKSRKHSICRSKDIKNNNPYSDRGLDKFSALLEELEDKRRKIYIQKGSEDISFVRFVYSHSNDFKPIVVKGRDKQHNRTSFDTKKNIRYPTNALPADQNEVIQQTSVESSEKSSQKKNIFFTWNIMKLDNWRRPSYYLPAIIIFILLFLAVFGRTFTILCVSIGWYFIPTIKGGDLHSERSKMIKKKENKIGRKSIDAKIGIPDGVSSPTSVISGMNNMSPKKHDHARSW